MRKPSIGFPNRSDTNRAVQAQLARGWKFWKKKNCMIFVVRTKARISLAVTAKLICAFDFTYAKCWFSHDTTQNDIVETTCKSDVLLRHRIQETQEISN